MPTVTKRLYPGAGAKGTILTRFIHPRVVAAVDYKYKNIAITCKILKVRKKRKTSRREKTKLK